MTKTAGTVLLGINGLLLAAALGFNVLVQPPSSSEAAVSLARIGSVVGQVEVRRGGQQSWTTAKTGDALGETDEIRTGFYSEATLHLRGASAVVVSADSSFVVGKEVVERSSFELGVGQITAAIPQNDAREYEFRSRGSDAVASSRQGEFSLTSDGKGTVVVDNKEGEVKVSAAGQEVLINKGKRSVVLPQKSPDVLPIPSSVALQVKWPPQKLDKLQTTITGKTTAGAVLMVNGLVVRADQNGEFSLGVSLHEGSNRVIVNATDGAGNSTMTESPDIQVDTKPPDLKVDAEGLWK